MRLGKRRSKLPAGAVNVLHEFGGFRVAGEFHFPVIPLEGSAGAVGDVAKQHHLGVRPGDLEAAQRRVALAGGVDIRCAPYATFGTKALARHAVKALKDCYACLLANHGMIALGKNMDEAVALAGEVECLAEQYWRVRLLKKHRQNGPAPNRRKLLQSPLMLCYQKELKRSEETSLALAALEKNTNIATADEDYFC